MSIWTHLGQKDGQLACVPLSETAIPAFTYQPPMGGVFNTPPQSVKKNCLRAKTCETLFPIVEFLRRAVVFSGATKTHKRKGIDRKPAGL